MIFADTAIQLVAGLLLLFLDPALVFGADDMSARLLFVVCCLFFMCVCVRVCGCVCSVDWLLLLCAYVLTAGVDNLFAWYFWGLAVQTFTVLMVSRHFWVEGLALVKRTYRTLMQKYV